MPLFLCLARQPPCSSHVVGTTCLFPAPAVERMAFVQCQPLIKVAWLQAFGMAPFDQVVEPTLDIGFSCLGDSSLGSPRHHFKSECRAGERLLTSRALLCHPSNFRPFLCEVQSSVCTRSQVFTTALHQHLSGCFNRRFCP